MKDGQRFVVMKSIRGSWRVKRMIQRMGRKSSKSLRRVDMKKNNRLKRRYKMKRIEDTYFNKVIRPLARAMEKDKKHPKSVIHTIPIITNIEERALEEALNLGKGKAIDLMEIKNSYFKRLRDDRQ